MKVNDIPEYTEPFAVTETTTVKAIAVKEDVTLPAPLCSQVAESVITIDEVATYTSVPRMKAAAQNLGTTKQPCEMNTNGLTVIGVKGSNLYVVDYTGEGILLYGSGTLYDGTASTSLVIGDQIGGTIKGKLQLYNGAAELGDVDFSGMTLNQQGVVVEPMAATIADITGVNRLDYESGLVKLTGLTFQATSLSSKNIKAKDASGAEVTIRDNYGVLSDFPFSTSATYDITAIVGYFNAVQLYPRSADDIVKVSGDDPQPHQLVGDGSLTNPYTVEDINSMEIPYTTDETGKKTYGNANGENKVWVKAQIIGYANGAFNADKVVFGSDMSELAEDKKVRSNIVIIDEANVTVTAAPELKYCAPVSLANSNATDKAIRGALNLADNSNLVSQTIYLYGDITMYFNTNGLKNLEKYSFDGTTILPSGDEPGPGPDPQPTDWSSSADAPLIVSSVLTKAESLEANAKSPDVYVEGEVSEIVDIEKGRYYISDPTGAKLYIYNGKSFNGADFQPNGLKVGDEVLLFGKVQNYVNNAGESTIELVSSKIITLNGETGGDTPEPTEVREAPITNPYGAAELRGIEANSTSENVQEGAWLKGYIVGYINGSTLSSSTAMFSASAPEGTDNDGNPLKVTASNILIGDTPNTTDVTAVVPIALQANGSARADLNLLDNPGKLGTLVWLKGNVRKYMGKTGLRDVTEYSLDGEDHSGDVGDLATIEGLREADYKGAAQIEGLVVAAYKSGVLVQDATGIMTVYTGAEPEVIVGDSVIVAGKTTTYGGLLQFGKDDLVITKTKDAADNNPVEYPEVTVIDGEAFDALVAKPEIKYVKVKGTFIVSGKYLNFSIDGAAAIGSILATDEVLGNAQNGDEITVTGFFAYNSSSKVAKYGNIVATRVNVDAAKETVAFESIPQMRAAAHELGTTVQPAEMNTNGLTVIGVKGKNIYVVDYTNEGGILLFGENTLNLEVGQTIGGTIRGNLQLYNGVAELGDVDYSDMSVLPAAVTVEPVEVTIAELVSNTVKYESGLVIIKGVNFGEAAAFEKNTTAIDESDNEIVIRDNYETFTGQAITVGADYDVTGIVTIYNEIPQLYPRSIEDIVKAGESDLQMPTSEWGSTSVVCGVGDDLYETYQVRFTTNSDGAVTYTSDNEAVATVDAEGHITPVGAGKAIITATTAATDTYRSSSATIGVIVSEATVTVDEVLATWDGETKQEDVLIRGYIVGYISGKNLSSAVFFRNRQNEAPAVTRAATDDEPEISNTNLLIATDKEETDVNKCIPVQLPAGDVRDALNLRDNTELALAEVELYGDVEKYFGVCGLKSVSAFKILSTEDAISNIAAVERSEAIYTLDGRRLSAVKRPGLYIIGGRKVVVK